MVVGCTSKIYDFDCVVQGSHPNSTSRLLIRRVYLLVNELILSNLALLFQRWLPLRCLIHRCLSVLFLQAE